MDRGGDRQATLTSTLVAGAIHFAGDLRVAPTRVYRENPRARIPTRSHPGDAGYDMYLCDDAKVFPFTFQDLDTGLRIALPPGVWARIVGRSSTLRKRGLLVVEGVIDRGYTGPMFFGVYNLSRNSVRLKAGERLAQLILGRVTETEWEEVEHANDLGETERGERGFGSTGD